MSFDLDRFHRAQKGEFDRAMSELQAGRKRSHWIWFIFQQLAGLGQSPMAQTYGLQGAGEGLAYLRDPVLRGRLLSAANAVREHLDNHPPVALRTVMGSDIDALKLVSSMTLFRAIAEQVGDHDVSSVAQAILRAAKAEGFRECQFTMTQLA